MEAAQDLERIVSTLNAEWKRLYGGVDVTDPKLVCARIVQLADDVRSWTFNAKQAQKEYQRLEAKINEHGHNK